ncbi:MAG: hypothetical protein J5509_05370 [Lachnospiraceae bacterium]|nr:hypothetical protein [Lachnospiraceae bacterium]
MSFGGFIPNRISNRTVIKTLDSMRKVQRRFHIAWGVSKKNINKNRIATDRLLGSFGEGPRPDKGAPGLLEKQNSYGDIAYGRSDMAYAGCEIIAVYNALISLGRRTDLQELIRDFEQDGMVLSGRFGTAPLAIRDHLTKKGLNVRTSLKPEEFDEIAACSDVSILTLYNDRRSIFQKIHTICITHSPGGYTAHNTYGDGVLIGPYPTISELISRINCGHAKGIVMFGIKN